MDGRKIKNNQRTIKSPFNEQKLEFWSIQKHIYLYLYNQLLNGARTVCDASRVPALQGAGIGEPA